MPRKSGSKKGGSKKAKKTNFQFDPNRNLLVWFSQDSEVFLSAENILRLIRRRLDNPHARISLLYSEDLLSATARADLLRFCGRLNITPISYESEIRPNPEGVFEPRVIEKIDLELAGILSGEGGNAAQASDMVRTIRCALRMAGGYTDFDTTYNAARFVKHRAARGKKAARTTFQTVDVASPLLMPFGLQSVGAPGKCRPAQVHYNNDFFAVVDFDAASEMLDRIHQQFIAAYSPAYRFESNFQQMCLRYHRFAMPKDARPDAAVIANFEYHNLTPNDQRSYNMLCSLTKRCSDKGQPSSPLFVRQDLAQDSDVLVEAAYAELVRHTTGPDAVAIALTADPKMPYFGEWKDLKKVYQPMSIFGYPELRCVFISPNDDDMFFSESAAGSAGAQAEAGGMKRDRSWTPGGAKAMRDKNEAINSAASLFQGVVRGHLERKHIREAEVQGRAATKIQALFRAHNDDDAMVMRAALKNP